VGSTDPRGSPFPFPPSFSPFLSLLCHRGETKKVLRDGSIPFFPPSSFSLSASRPREREKAFIGPFLRPPQIFLSLFSFFFFPFLFLAGAPFAFLPFFFFRFHLVMKESSCSFGAVPFLLSFFFAFAIQAEALRERGAGFPRKGFLLSLFSLIFLLLFNGFMI